MRVFCDIEHIELYGDYAPIRSVRATCSRCGHEVESYGDGESSIKRCLAAMREECPEGENNYYVAVGRNAPEPSPSTARKLPRTGVAKLG